MPCGSSYAPTPRRRPPPSAKVERPAPPVEQVEETMDLPDPLTDLSRQRDLA